MQELTRFKRWAERNRAGRGLLCHFYEAEGKQKQYYTKLDYAYFNLFSNSPNWVIKGTIGHGIRSKRGKPSQVPCFNCYQVDEEFYMALKAYCKESYTKYGIGIIFSKRRIKNLFGDDNVMDVEKWDFRKNRPSPGECWKYDIGGKPRKKLWPFHNCQVVRIRIPPSNLYSLPIASIPKEAITGLLVKKEGYNIKMMEKILENKRWKAIEIFPLL